MGNSIQINQTLSYRTNTGHEILLPFKELKGKQNFPKLPSHEKDIQAMFQKWLSKIIIGRREKEKLKGIPLKYKFRLCYKHEKIISELAKNEQEKKKIIQDTVVLLTNLNEKYEITTIEALYRNLSKDEYLETKIEQLIKEDVMVKLIQELKTQELLSRHSKNFRLMIAIIKVIERFLHSEAGVKCICDTPNFFSILFSTLHPIEPEISGTMLQVFGGKFGLCWEPECLLSILDSMTEYQNNYRLQTKFDVLLRSVYYTRNLLIIFHMLKFLFNFLFCVDKPESDILKQELLDTIVSGKKVGEVFQQIKIRIVKDYYQIKDSTYQGVRQNLASFQHPLCEQGTSDLDFFSMQKFKTITEKPTKEQLKPNIEFSVDEIGNVNFENCYYLEESDLKSFSILKIQVFELMDGIINLDSIKIQEDEEEYLNNNTQQDQNKNVYHELQQLQQINEDSEADSDENDFFESQHVSLNLQQQHKTLQEIHEVLKEKYEEQEKQIKELQKQILNEKEKNKQLEECQQLLIQNVKENEEQTLQKEFQQQLELLKLKYEEQLNQLNTQISNQKINIENQKISEQQLFNQIENFTLEIQGYQQSIMLLQKVVDEFNQSEIKSPDQQLDEQSNKTDQNSELSVSPPKLTSESISPSRQQNESDDNQIIILQKIDDQSTYKQDQEIQTIQINNISHQEIQTITIITESKESQTIQQEQQSQIISLNEQIQPQNSNINIPTPPPPPPPLPNQKGNVQNGNIPLPPPLIIKGNAPPPPPFGKLVQKQIDEPFKFNKIPQIPSIPMKTINWILIQPSNVKGTIYEKLYTDNYNIDKISLEKSFFKIHQAQSSMTLSTVRKAVAQTKIQLIGSDRSKNIELVLVKIQLPNSLLVKALFSIDQNVLTDDAIDSLDVIIPTEDEIKTVAEFQGQKELLGVVEQFIDNLRQVNGFQHRIKSLKFKSVYDDYKQDLIEKMNILSKRFQELRNMKGLEKIILITLNIGNFLNVNTPRGGAVGFKIEALDNCSDIKSSDGSNSNLLLYIIEKAEEELKQDIINEEKMRAFEILQRVPVNQLVTDLSSIKKGSQHIKKAMESQTDNPEDQVHQKLQNSYEQVQQDLEQLEKQMQKVEDEYQQCALYFGENPKESSDKFGDKIMKIFRTILRQKFEKIQRDERNKRQEALRKRQMNRNQPLTARSEPQKIIITDKRQSIKQGDKRQSLLKVLEAPSNKQQKKSFIANEISQLIQMKQARTSIFTNNK